MLIYGKNTATEAFKSGKQIDKIYLSSDLTDQRIIQLAKNTKAEIVFMPRSKMDENFHGNHQGVVVKVIDYEYCNLRDVLEKYKNEDAVLAILDGLEDPHNLGAILRTADATGVNGIIIPKHRSVSLNATVAKVSTGAIEYANVVQVTNLVTTIKELKKNGYWIIGLELDGSVDYRKQDYSGKIAVVIGSEGKGISRLVKEECDFCVNIPMYGHVNSLNASVSAAILFYEILRNRGK